MTLEWTPREDGTEITRCGRYSVSPKPDTQDAWISYRLVPGGAWFSAIGKTVFTSAAAKYQCQADSERSQ